MYMNPAIIEMELEHRRQEFIRDAQIRHLREELVHAPNRVWRDVRPLRALFPGRRSQSGVCA